MGMTENEQLLATTLFVYAKDGRIHCLHTEEARSQTEALLATGWTHTATINPARWIEHLCNDGGDSCDMMDELQFSKP